MQILYFFFSFLGVKNLQIDAHYEEYLALDSLRNPPHTPPKLLYF